ncbi:hypothetical protein GCM10009868_26460 [Terrabacter aerolatus]|uniref:Cyclic-phosphate processing Receiver domain-containing protein n=1 Tax=Terrabacter aerolatus TaxID=422442 RepID=A0A512D5F0_9MICO|nr:cyclic-phosphate processing receiver domain-containing protein [Terrabacter aerolatus]GEO31682.1 hypothetical protein TAE01_34920 [Terrabacter aerolatus]
MHPSLSAEPSAATPLTVLVDDTRAFRDRRPHVQVRHGDDAVELLRRVRDRLVDELWLDYDLLDGTTSASAVDHLVARAARGNRLSVNVIEVHAARVPEALHITQRLRRAGYPARRCYAQGIWTRFDATLHDEWRPEPGGGMSDRRTPIVSEKAALAEITEGVYA